MNNKHQLQEALVNVYGKILRVFHPSNIQETERYIIFSNYITPTPANNQLVITGRDISTIFTKELLMLDLTSISSTGFNNIDIIKEYTYKFSGDWSYEVVLTS